MRLLTFLLMSFLCLSTARADETDFHTGIFTGVWCGAPVTYKITSRDSTGWVFRGEISLRETGEVDKIVVEQKSSQSLVMSRYLSGQNDGKVQSMTTNPPKKLSVDGRRQAYFSSRQTEGEGCENNSGELWMWY